MSNKNGLSLIVPIYNEAKGISNSITSIRKLEKNINFPFEIILVNDGSNDGTEEILKKIVNKDSKIKLINNFLNLGYGAALKRGIKLSKFDNVVITDADETYPNELIPEFFKKFSNLNLDMLVGARVGKNVKIPLIRKPAKYFINTLANYLSGTKIPDLNSGLRIMKKEILLKYFNILPDGFSFTTTITLAMLTNNYTVHYEKIDYFHRIGKSKIKPIQDTLNFIILILRTILLFNPLKIFIPLSFILFLMGILLIIYRFYIGSEYGVTATVLLVGSLQILAIGLLADLIDRRIEK
tara:strand:- start:864 stop:1751 length:888 start_codon:yes stop_codon:yes gene_type:complete